MSTLESLSWDNRSLASLPLDPEKRNFIRQVPNAIFSLVEPTPVVNPSVVAVSTDALGLLGITKANTEEESFKEYFSGNKVLPGARPAAHCYCGHQFGNFSGQLGDGATMYLGEVINEENTRWEIQFKGAGKTPYSRTADGRKVLRSSLREFLCSEANYHLGIPTTRAGTCVTSDTLVERDIFYCGDVIRERASIITRIAQTFIRFGSFEIFKHTDAYTGRTGPSAGNYELQKKLLDFVVSSYYPEIQSAFQDEQGRYLEFFSELCRRTAHMVVEWQANGFCHGVLNTDNMSVVGLTIDYGPFGYMEAFDRGFVCNGSDDSGRYDYQSQPAICGWNLGKLAESLHPTLDQALSKPLIAEHYTAEFSRKMHAKYLAKLGLQQVELGDKEDELIAAFLDTAQTTGVDWTNAWRCLKRVPVVPADELQSHTGIDEVLDYLMTEVATVEFKAEALVRRANSSRPRIPPDQLLPLIEKGKQDPSFLVQLSGGQAPPEAVMNELMSEKVKLDRYQELLLEAKRLQSSSQDEQLPAFREAWRVWLVAYQERLSKEVVEGKALSDVRTAREQLMDRTNPRLVLRNWIAQLLIDTAEAGDYASVQEMSELFKHPFALDGSPEAQAISGRGFDRQHVDRKHLAVT